MPQVDMASIMSVAVAIGLVYIIGKILLLPIKLISKLMINGVVGAVVLFALNALGEMAHIYIPINPITSLVAGVLGIPGIILLIFLKFIL